MISLIKGKNTTPEQWRMHRDALSVFFIFQKNHQMKQVQQGLYVACISIIVFLSTTPATTAFSPSHEKQKHTNNRLLMVRFTSRVSPLSSLFRVRSPALTAAGLGVLPAGSSRWSLPAGPGLAPPQPVSIRQEGKPRYRPACAPNAPSRGRAAWMDG